MINFINSVKRKVNISYIKRLSLTLKAHSGPEPHPECSIAGNAPGNRSLGAPGLGSVNYRALRMRPPKALWASCKWTVDSPFHPIGENQFLTELKVLRVFQSLSPRQELKNNCLVSFLFIHFIYEEVRWP